MESTSGQGRLTSWPRPRLPRSSSNGGAPKHARRFVHDPRGLPSCRSCLPSCVSAASIAVGGRWDVAHDRGVVAQGVERDRQHDESCRKSEAEEARARSERRSERKEGADDERPAADVVYEGGAAVQPPMLLVSEEGEARDSERERHCQPPETMLELPARKTEVGATRKHHHLRPGAVR